MPGRADEALAELIRRRADLVPHGSGSLQQHLQGVHAVLERWGQPERVRLAGLLHSVYSTEAFRRALVDRSERPRVREIVGEDAERLVFAFCACPREALLAAAERDGGPVQIASRWQGVEIPLSRRDLGDLMVLHAANLADQVGIPPDGPGPWLAAATRLLTPLPEAEEIAPPVAPREDGGLPPRFARYLGGLRTNAERPLMQFYPGLRTEPWHDPRAFPIVADLERLAPQISAEARSFDASFFQDEAEEIRRTGRWSVLFLLEMGRPNERALARCPAARSILEARGMLGGHLGSMYFSCLEPGTRVAAHQGPTNLRLRCHLGIEVPEGCGVRVGGVSSTWQEGRCIVFDDSFTHEVWNDGDRRRVVLVLDLWHPDLSEDEVALLTGLHRYGVATVSGPRAFWARNEAARAPRTAPKEDALAAARRAVAESPGDARRHLVLGHELSSRERHAEAEASARAAIAIDPSLPMAHNNLGWALEMRGDTEGAIAAYEQALDLDDTCGRARANLASLLSSLGRFTEALHCRQAGLYRDPDNPAILADVIGEAMRAGELEIAAALAERQAGICRGTRWYPVRRPDDPALPASVRWDRVLTPGKLLHDVEQLEYLERRGILRGELAPVVAAYDRLLDTLRPLGPEARVPLVGAALGEIGHVYNRIVHVRETPRVPRALSGAWSSTAVEDAYLARKPGVVVVDRFLSDEAIESLRLFCLESTVWSENRYNHGRLGAMFQDGFNCPLLIQIAEEIRAALPRILGDHLPARQLWGYKYGSSSPAETAHADFSCVNVNVWITPEEANLDPSTGGLVVYDVAAPPDWEFGTYNNNVGVKIHELLKARKAVPRHIAYRYNRALIFDSAMFHATPQLTFRSGYENRRMNVTALFGSRIDR